MIITKKIVAYLLVVIFVSQVLAKFFIVADYVMNVEKITALFCVNKSKPMLHCDGKCYLAKQLKKQDSKEKPVQESGKFKLDLYTSYLYEPKIFVINSTKELLVNYYHYQSAPPKSLSKSVFHPPCC